jgi:hypothetical protein
MTSFARAAEEEAAGAAIVEVEATELDEDGGAGEVRELESNKGKEEEGGGEAKMSRDVLRGRKGTKRAESGRGAWFGGKFARLGRVAAAVVLEGRNGQRTRGGNRSGWHWSGRPVDKTREHCRYTMRLTVSMHCCVMERVTIQRVNVRRIGRPDPLLRFLRRSLLLPACYIAPITQIILPHHQTLI